VEEEELIGPEEGEEQDASEERPSQENPATAPTAGELLFWADREGQSRASKRLVRARPHHEERLGGVASQRWAGSPIRGTPPEV